MSITTVQWRRLLPVFIGCLMAAVPAFAQPRETLARGELLYNAHCVACHTTQIHWRSKKLVADWASLKGQVKLWQANDGLAWSDADINSVALYLNKLHYGYPVDVYGRADVPGIHQASARH